MEYFERRSHRARVVRDAIRTAVVEGTWGAHPLPSEPELSQQFGVGRNVVREALSGLVAEGLLVRQQGAGTRPVARVVLHATDRLKTLNEDPDGPRKDRLITHQVLRWDEVPASPLHASALDVPVGTPIVCLERVTRADTPLIFWSTFLRADLGLRPPAPVGGTSSTGFYAYLEAAGLSLGEGHVRTSAVACDEAVAELLEVPVGSPALVQSRRLHLRDGRTVEASTGYYRPDQVALTNTFAR